MAHKRLRFYPTSENTLLTASSKPEAAMKVAKPKKLLSPIWTGDTHEQKNDPAINARRERKILDLEITNSSLAAINRELERQMRKQTHELRRFKRIGRPGIFPLSQCSPIDALQGGEINHVLSTEISDKEDDDIGISNEMYGRLHKAISKDDSVPSEVIASNNLRYSTNDGKRLQLNLAKQQEMLTASQRMNQTLHRCLGMTDDMIKQGVEALKYTVTPEEIELGGRVLDLDDMEGNENDEMSELAYKF